MTPQEIALRNLSAMEDQWREAGITPPHALSNCKLTRYATENDYKALRPEDGPSATLEEHNEILNAFSDLIEHRYHVTPEIIVLDASQYLRWLAREDRRNTAENRALFISTKTAE